MAALSLFTVLCLNLPFCLTDRAEETGVNTVIQVQPKHDLRFNKNIYDFIIYFIDIFLVLTLVEIVMFSRLLYLEFKGRESMYN
jgi:hypothetical protein